MSYEETLVCDGCSTVIDGGRRSRSTVTLAGQAGRFFNYEGYDSGRHVAIFREVSATFDADRHLCGSCATTATEFVGGDPVPPPATPEGPDA